mgnify:CR=1 FL=1
MQPNNSVFSGGLLNGREFLGFLEAIRGLHFHEMIDGIDQKKHESQSKNESLPEPSGEEISDRPYRMRNKHVVRTYIQHWGQHQQPIATNAPGVSLYSHVISLTARKVGVGGSVETMHT